MDFTTGVRIFLYLALASVVIIWIYGFIILAKGKINANATSRFVLLLGSGVTLVAAILWLGATLNNALPIPQNTVTAIWGTLIVGVLGTSLTVYKQHFKKNGKFLSIDRLLLLDEHKGFSGDDEVLGSLYNRNNSNYTRGEERILFCAIISGFAEKSSGSIDLQVETVVRDNNNLAASLLPKGQCSNPDRWKSKPYADSIHNIIEDSKDLEDEFTLVIGMVEDIPSFISSGLMELQLTVIDNVSHLVSRRSKEIVVT